MNNGRGGAFVLTIAIPSYNRATKLERTLASLRDQVIEAGLCSAVRILVSDNGSTDSTPEVAARFDGRGVRVDFARQAQNLGLDGNIWELYRLTETAFIWFFCDDDVPFPGAVATVHQRLQVPEPPAVLRFSFTQPPGSTHRTFDFPEEFVAVTSPRRQIELVASFYKLTTYVMRRLPITPALEARVRPFMGGCYSFVPLAFEALEVAGPLELVTRPLAGADDGYSVLRFRANVWRLYAQVFEHDFVTRYAPDLAEQANRHAYLDLVGFLWAWRRGILQVEPDLEADYWTTLRELELNWSWLGTSRKRLAQAVLMKLAPRAAPRAMTLVSGISRSA